MYIVFLLRLKNFYKKYGYTEVDTPKEVVHPIILEKYNWCLDHYESMFYYLSCKST